MYNVVGERFVSFEAVIWCTFESWKFTFVKFTVSFGGRGVRLYDGTRSSGGTARSAKMQSCRRCLYYF
mgnify:CR=1 FL=1